MGCQPLSYSDSTKPIQPTSLSLSFSRSVCDISGFQRTAVETSVFLYVMQGRLVVVYRRLGTAYRSHLDPILTLEDGTDMLTRNVGEQVQTYVA